MVAPTSGSVTQGSSTTSAISTTVTSGSAQSVALSASGLPSGATATFAVRNLHKWTSYTGIDPEANADAGSTANVASDFQTIPPPTYFIFRLNLAF